MDEIEHLKIELDAEQTSGRNVFPELSNEIEKLKAELKEANRIAEGRQTVIDSYRRKLADATANLTAEVTAHNETKSKLNRLRCD